MMRLLFLCFFDSELHALLGLAPLCLFTFSTNQVVVLRNFYSTRICANAIAFVA